MRFPSEDLGRIRRGEITAALRPARRERVNKNKATGEDGRMQEVALSIAERLHPGSRKLPLEPIQRVEQVRTEFPVHDAITGERLLDADSEPRSFVLYETKAFATDEVIEIATVTRSTLGVVIDETIEGCGYESREDMLALFCDQYGGNGSQPVWLIEFRYATDMPRFLGRPGHGDYVHSPADAIDELEPVDENTLVGFAEHNRAKDTLRRLDMTAARLEDKVSLESQLGEVRRLAKERGIDIRSTERLIQRKLNEVKRKLGDAA